MTASDTIKLHSHVENHRVLRIDLVASSLCGCLRLVTGDGCLSVEKMKVYVL